MAVVPIGNLTALTTRIFSTRNSTRHFADPRRYFAGGGPIFPARYHARNRPPLPPYRRTHSIRIIAFWLRHMELQLKCRRSYSRAPAKKSIAIKIWEVSQARTAAEYGDEFTLNNSMPRLRSRVRTLRGHPNSFPGPRIGGRGYLPRPDPHISPEFPD